MSNRDDFSEKDKRTLSDQVNGLCSRCRASTRGPHSEDGRAVHVGVAAHIRGAAPLGPRYDPGQTPRERAAIENGIYLCSSCAALVDKDEAKYPPALLEEWKAAAKRDAEVRLLGGSAAAQSTSGPHLRLSLIPPEGEAGPWWLPDRNGLPIFQTVARFFHLRVSNDARRLAQATEVQVLLTRIDHESPGGDVRTVWSGDSVPVWWRYQEQHPFKRTIGPHAELDLCCVVRDPPGSRLPLLQLRVSLEHMRIVIPGRLRPYLNIPPHQPVVLHLEARSLEADSEPFKVRVAWDGQWSEDAGAMARHVRLEVVG